MPNFHILLQMMCTFWCKWCAHFGEMMCTFCCKWCAHFGANEVHILVGSWINEFINKDVKPGQEAIAEFRIKTMFESVMFQGLLGLSGNTIYHFFLYLSFIYLSIFYLSIFYLSINLLSIYLSIYLFFRVSDSKHYLGF